MGPGAVHVRSGGGETGAERVSIQTYIKQYQKVDPDKYGQ